MTTPEIEEGEDEVETTVHEAIKDILLLAKQELLNEEESQSRGEQCALEAVDKALKTLNLLQQVRKEKGTNESTLFNDVLKACVEVKEVLVNSNKIKLTAEGMCDFADDLRDTAKSSLQNYHNPIKEKVELEEAIKERKKACVDLMIIDLKTASEQTEKDTVFGAFIKKLRTTKRRKGSSNERSSSNNEGSGSGDGNGNAAVGIMKRTSQLLQEVARKMSGGSNTAADISMDKSSETLSVSDVDTSRTNEDNNNSMVPDEEKIAEEDEDGEEDDDEDEIVIMQGKELNEMKKSRKNINKKMKASLTLLEVNCISGILNGVINKTVYRCGSICTWPRPTNVNAKPPSVVWGTIVNECAAEASGACGLNELGSEKEKIDYAFKVVEQERIKNYDGIAEKIVTKVLLQENASNEMGRRINNQGKVSLSENVFMTRQIREMLYIENGVIMDSTSLSAHLDDSKHETPGTFSIRPYEEISKTVERKHVDVLTAMESFDFLMVEGAVAGLQLLTNYVNNDDWTVVKPHPYSFKDITFPNQESELVSATEFLGRAYSGNLQKYMNGWQGLYMCYRKNGTVRWFLLLNSICRFDMVQKFLFEDYCIALALVNVICALRGSQVFAFNANYAMHEHSKRYDGKNLVRPIS